MELFTINTGLFKLDGGAMFGVVPKSIWNNINPADENNMCTWSMRCLLVKENNRLILIDTGIGNKQSEKFFSYYYLHGNDSLEKSLHQLGIDFADITDVFLTHLHFDHCGGAISFDKNKERYYPTFPNATYWSHSQHWAWAIKPNAREKASFLKENILPIQESGQLKFVDKDTYDLPFEYIDVYGHTEAMILPIIPYKNYKVFYTADLIPSAGHIPIPYVMAYDVRPLITLQEKENLLKKALDENWLLYFEHDHQTELCNLENTERGIRMKEKLTLSDI
ncbi:MAG: MBL fold metallo-hydrolase [Bacteroidetes bacterium]|nr:MAG: MBL fold metallo-hydrolase [Bacteroidota bacterium]